MSCVDFLWLKSHRITGWLRVEGTAGGHLLQPPCSGRAPWSWLPRTVSRCLWSISKDRETQHPSGQPLPVLSHPYGVRGSLLRSRLCLWPLVPALGTPGRSRALSLQPPSRQSQTSTRSPASPRAHTHDRSPLSFASSSALLQPSGEGEKRS